MSNYNKMSGEYHLTVSDIKKVHTELRRFLKEEHEEIYHQVIADYNCLGGSSAISKFLKNEYIHDSKKRNYTGREYFERKFYQLSRSSSDIIRHFEGKKPTKSYVIKNYTSKSEFFENEYGCIRFYEDSIRVSVVEGNRAVERFEETPEWIGLVKAFKNLKWSKLDCGGCLWYLDEYMREDDRVESRAVHCFGKVGERIKFRGNRY